MANMTKILLLIVLTGCLFQSKAQNFCGESTRTLEESTSNTTLCSNDVLQLSYNAEDNTSNLPNYVYVVEGPGGLILLEEELSLNIIPAQLGATESDSLFVSGVAYNIENINFIISKLSDLYFCMDITKLSDRVCQEIANSNNEGELSKFSEALAFATTLGFTPPTTIEDVVLLINDINNQLNGALIACVAISNNGLGKDYYYIVDPGNSAQQTINLNSVIDTASYYLAKDVVVLDAGFYTNSEFYAAIGNCE